MKLSKEATHWTPPRACYGPGRGLAGLLLSWALLAGCASGPAIEPPDPVQKPAVAWPASKIHPTPREQPALLWDQVAPRHRAPGPTTVNASKPDGPAAIEVALPPDLWLRLRSGMAIDPLRGTAATRAQAHQRWYLANGMHLHRTFARARPYLFDIVEAVEQEGLPSEIALLPAVESAFNATARSHAQAEGLWQFIRPTARRFALQQHLFVDDRRSVRAATRAALRYLSELRARYGGDSQLALAAYNTGEGNVDAAIRRARARGLPGRYEDLMLHPETMAYVPKLIALAEVVAAAVDAGDLASAGLPPMPDAPYFTAVRVARDIDIRKAAELADMRLDDFVALNPQHLKPVMAVGEGLDVLLPTDRARAFQDALEAYSGPLTQWSAVRVRQRGTVEVLAREHGISPAAFRAVNEVPSGYMVAAGSVIVVPRSKRTDDISDALLEAPSLQTIPFMKRLKVRVAKMESWMQLSRRLGVDAESLQRWNAGVRLPLAGGSATVLVPTSVVTRVHVRKFKSPKSSG